MQEEAKPTTPEIKPVEKPKTPISWIEAQKIRRQKREAAKSTVMKPA